MKLFYGEDSEYLVIYDKLIINRVRNKRLRKSEIIDLVSEYKDKFENDFRQKFNTELYEFSDSKTLMTYTCIENNTINMDNYPIIIEWVRNYQNKVVKRINETKLI